MVAPRPASAGKARHPRSRAERALLVDLEHTLSRSLAICSSEVGEDVLAMEASRVAAEARTARTKAIADIVAGAATGKVRLSSNGPPRPSLFYEMPAAAKLGTGLPGHPRTSAPPDDGTPPIDALPPRDDAALRHYGVHQLSEYARSTMLGELSDYLPAHRDESSCRARFDALITRVQQHQLAMTVQNELRARRPDSMWNWPESHRYHLEPVVATTKRPIEVNAWAAFIQAGGDPAAEGLGFEIVPHIRAQRAPVEV